MTAKQPIDRREGQRRRRRMELESGSLQVVTRLRLKIVPAIEDTQRAGREIRLHHPVILNLPRALAAHDTGAQILTRLILARNAALDQVVDGDADRFLG